MKVWGYKEYYDMFWEWLKFRFDKIDQSVKQVDLLEMMLFIEGKRFLRYDKSFNVGKLIVKCKLEKKEKDEFWK